jgi:hypothetical protein
MKSEDESSYQDEIFTQYDVSYYTDTDSMSDISTGSLNKRYKKIQKKLVDKGFHKFIKESNDKLIKIGFYETNNTPGTLIRSAITGNRYEKFYVGSYIEDLFFKVCNTTIETGKRGPLIMFFNSPEEFEKHFRCVLSEDVKQKWRIKNKIAILRREEFLKKEVVKHDCRIH